jgi:hypothetical protein
VPEFDHWLHASNVSRVPSEGNTAMRLPDEPPEALLLRPPSGPGRDSRGAAAGGLVKPQPALGWSLADVQVRWTPPA